MKQTPINKIIAYLNVMISEAEKNANEADFDKEVQDNFFMEMETLKCVKAKATELLAEEREFAMDFSTWCCDNNYYSAPNGWIHVKHDIVTPIEQSEILNRYIETYGGGDE